MRFSLLPIFFFLFLLPFAFSCSTPSWFPIKKGPPHKAKIQELLDKEVVIIDKREYVKVINPRSSEQKDQPKYLYIPVDDYLAQKEAYLLPTTRKSEPPGSSPAMSGFQTPPKEEQRLAPSLQQQATPRLKKKVLLAHFDDRTTQGEEMFGDWVAEKMMREVERRSSQILFVDYLVIKEFLERRGFSLHDLEDPEVLRSLNEVFGVQALVTGHLSGPYVFSSKTSRDPEATASATFRIEMKLFDTISGRPRKQFTANNPILAVREKGVFSEERAKTKAIELTIRDLSAQLAKELEGWDWSCRIVRVEGEEVYLNAGRLTGLRLGDILEVFAPGPRAEKTGRLRVSSYLGLDASIGRPVDGTKPNLADIVKAGKF